MLASRGSSESRLRPGFSLYLEDKGKRPIIDQTDARLLRFIGEEMSISKASEIVGISYRNAWDRISGMEQRLGFKMVTTKVGGIRGGGAQLTPKGEALLKEFRHLRRQLFNILEDSPTWNRDESREPGNKLRARVVEVEKGGKSTVVRMRLLGHASLTSIISNETASGLEIRPGDDVEAILQPAATLTIAKLAGRGRPRNSNTRTNIKQQS